MSLRPIGSIVHEALVGLKPRDAVPPPALPRPLSPLPASAVATAVR